MWTNIFGVSINVVVNGLKCCYLSLREVITIGIPFILSPNISCAWIYLDLDYDVVLVVKLLDRRISFWLLNIECQLVNFCVIIPVKTNNCLLIWKENSKTKLIKWGLSLGLQSPLTGNQMKLISIWIELATMFWVDSTIRRLTIWQKEFKMRKKVR